MDAAWAAERVDQHQGQKIENDQFIDWRLFRIFPIRDREYLPSTASGWRYCLGITVMSMIDENIEQKQSTIRMRRREASRHLRDKYGVECAPQTLAKLAVTGGGPEYELFGRVPYYSPAKLDEWVLSQLKPRRSTSDSGIA